MDALKVSLIILWIAPLVYCTKYAHTIYIDPSTGADTQECLTANSQSSPCANLTWVFNQSHSSSTHYVLSGATHYLKAPAPAFQDLNSLSLTGNNSLVTCTQPNTGLAFINVANIQFQGIIFTNCSAIRNSTSKNFLTNSIMEFRVALYLYLCESVSMSEISVLNSPNATGVVLYDTNGTNTFTRSNFSHNTFTSLAASDYPGGGGFYVEFTYCQPGMLTCDLPNNSTRNDGSSYTFTECDFGHNQAGNLDNVEEDTYIFPYRSDHQAFGRGGGLSLFIRNKVAGVKFTVDKSRFHNNTAAWGAGLLVELHDSVHSNTITVSNCEFKHNFCPFKRDRGTAGAAIRLAHYVYGLEGDTLPTTAKSNVILINNSKFLNNTSLYGAGVSVSWALQNALVDQLVKIRILNSLFQSNMAKLGSAIHVDQFWMISQGLEPVVWIENAVFDNNTDQYFRVLQHSSIIDPLQVGYGVVCVTSSNVWFRGNISFTNSLGSALAVAGGTVNFNGSSALFQGNVANKGGAIALVGASIIEVGYGTKMMFQNNTALTKGGAINVVYISRENLASDPKCFIRHVDPSVVPDKWNVSIKFIDNWQLRGSNRNSIYSTSLLPCSILGGSGLVANRSEILCWEGWEYYEGNKSVPCHTLIQSDIGNIDYTGEDFEARNHVKAFPGWDFFLPVNVTDELQNQIDTAAFSSTVDNTNTTQLIYGEKTSINGEELTTYHMNVATLGERVWYVDMYVDLQLCPPGFRARGGVCVCANTYGGVMLCNFKAKEAILLKNLWMGMFNDSYFIVGCPQGYCKELKRNRSVLLPNTSQELNGILCAENRNGTLCGECTEGYGPAINSKTFDCIICANISLAANVVKYVASVYLPLAALFTVLILFDIRLTTGPANAFILYCQVVSSNFGLDADGQIPLEQFTSQYQQLIAAYTIPYGVFNLEFVKRYIPDLCFSTSFNTLTVLCLEYCVALSPLLMILLVVILSKFQRTCCSVSRLCLVSKSSKFLRKQRRSIGEAILPAFASFLLLSYTKFSTVSAYIVTTRPLTNENSTQNQHNLVYLAGQFTYSSPAYYPYLTAAIFVFCTFVAIPPLLLLDFPLRGVEWVVSKSRLLERVYPSVSIHILLDTFQGCFRENMRFFAGLYFLFRLVLNVSYMFCSTWSQQFFVQQIACTVMVVLVALCRPYKWVFLNGVDILIFTNLAVLNSISHYFFQVFQSSEDQSPPLFVFIFQYVLVFLPLLYMLTYIVYSGTKRYHPNILKNIRSLLLKCCPSSTKDRQLDTVVRDDMSVSSYSHSLSTSKTHSVGPQSHEDAFFARAEETNRYQSPLPVTIVGVRITDSCGDASVRQTMKDSGLPGANSGTGSRGHATYGSTGVSSGVGFGSSSRSDSGNQT